MGPASSGNCAVRNKRTSSMRFTALAEAAAVGLSFNASAAKSWLNSWSRKTVRPSLSESWNQSRQVTRLPVQLWKYSWPTTLSMLA